MNSILKASAAALLAATILPSAASAACSVDLSAAEKAIGDRRDAYGPSAPDFRQLRDAARTLSRYNKDAACESVVKAINEMASAPPTYMRDTMPGTTMAPGAPAPATGTAPAPAPRPVATAPAPAAPGFQYDRMTAVKDATPLSEGKGIVSTNDIIGSTLYSAADGRSVGEIEDIVMGATAADAYAIVGYGGFLGMGEKKVRVPLKDLLVNANYNTYYVKMADADFKSAPGLRKVEGRWVDAAAK